MTTTSVTLEVDPKAAWLEGRRKFIGGSEAYKLLNEEQYGQGCSRALAYEKLGAEPDFDDTPDADMEALFKRGNVLEPVVAALYKEETGRESILWAERRNRLPESTHAQRVFLGRRSLRSHDPCWPADVTETGDLEIKTRSEGPFYRMLRTGPFKGDFLQTQWANFVTGHLERICGSWGVWFDSNPA